MKKKDGSERIEVTAESLAESQMETRERKHAQALADRQTDSVPARDQQPVVAHQDRRHK